jgi:hypothetical protein
MASIQLWELMDGRGSSDYVQQKGLGAAGDSSEDGKAA